MARRLLLSVLVLMACVPLVAQVRPGTPAQTPAGPPVPEIRLVVLVAADQFRQDYFWRFRHEFTGGLQRLASRGAMFSNAFLEHYPTVTAVGHAAMLSGAMPSVSGIIGNDWYDRETGRQVQSITDDSVTLLGAEGNGASPRRLLVTTVADELKMAAPRGAGPERTPKVIGVSFKDRAAILPAGRGADAAYWMHAATGPFVSSTYYQPALPEWVVAFNTRPPVTGPKGGVTTNAQVIAFASEALAAEKLGQRQVTDVLTVSLSENDTIGHAFGPDSIQVRDVSIATDRLLGEFFATIDKLVGLDHTLVIFTADHAVAPVPELQAQRRMPGGRVDGVELFAGIQAALDSKYGPGEWLSATAGSSPYLNHGLIAQRGLDVAEVRRVVADAAMKAPYVARAYTRDQLLRGELPQDLVGRRVLNGFHAQRSGDVEIIFEPYWMRQKQGTTHGTPYNYDAHVPLIFMGPGVTPGHYPQKAALNDLAPTLATILEVETPSAADGRILAEMLPRR